MDRRELILFRRGLVAFDLVITAAAFIAIFFFRQWLAIESQLGQLPGWMGRIEVPLVEEPRLYYEVLLGVLLFWWFAFYVSGTSDFRVSYAQMASRYLRAVGIGLALFLSGFFLLKLTFVARSFVVLFAATDLLLLIVGRVAVMETVAFLRSKRADGHRLLVVGVGPQAVKYARSIHGQPPWNVKLLGFVAGPGEEYDPAIPEEQRHGSVLELERFLNSTPVDEVLFANSGLDNTTLANALHVCDERGIDVLLPLPPSIPQRSRVEIANIHGIDLPLLGLRRTPTNEVNLALKRLIDLLGGMVMLMLSGPIMLVAAIAIRLESKGPIFFKQTRAGRNGRKFTMYKFRSMVVDAEAKKAALAHLNEMSGPVFKIKRDPRITKVGHFIRRTSIDELPQVFNILLGDMSLVGPRPPLPAEVEQYQPWQRRRLSVKPGLTGLWQVSGRNNVDFEEWMALDLRYIDDWSLWLDLKILLRTVPAVIFKTGAS